MQHRSTSSGAALLKKLIDKTIAYEKSYWYNHDKYGADIASL
jgi:hypothetical protein